MNLPLPVSVHELGQHTLRSHEFERILDPDIPAKNAPGGQNICRLIIGGSSFCNPFIPYLLFKQSHKSITHSLTHPNTLIHTHSPIHPLTHTHSITRSPTHTHSHTRSLTHSLNSSHTVTHTLTHTHSITRSPTNSLTHTHSLIRTH